MPPWAWYSSSPSSWSCFSSGFVFVLFGGLFFPKWSTPNFLTAASTFPVGFAACQTRCAGSGGRRRQYRRCRAARSKRFAHLPGVALVADALHRRAGGGGSTSEFCPALPGDGFYHFFQRQAVRVVVDAEFGRLAVPTWAFSMPSFFFQRGDEAPTQASFFVGDFREEEGDFELEFFMMSVI